MKNNRNFFARSFCAGQGIEVGALIHPLTMPPEAKVRYVDRMSNEDLLLQYPEVDPKVTGQPLVDIDVIDDGETLSTFPDESEDFIIACQFIEHCQNPIRTLVNMLRVVRNNRFIIITAPDKRFTFDKDRPITSNEHLLEEAKMGAAANRRQHFREWVTLVDKTPPEQVDSQIEKLLAQNYSIHYHVWDSDAFLKFLLFTKEQFRLPIDIHSILMNGNELMVAMRKVVQ